MVTPLFLQDVVFCTKKRLCADRPLTFCGVFVSHCVPSLKMADDTTLTLVTPAELSKRNVHIAPSPLQVNISLNIHIISVF